MKSLEMEMWTWWTWLGSALGLFAFVQNFLPIDFRNVLTRAFRHWLNRFSPHVYFRILEFDGPVVNELYQDVHIYLSTVVAEGAQCVNLCQAKNTKALTFSLANDQRMQDYCNGAKVHWVHYATERHSQMWTVNREATSDEKRFFQLQVNRADKQRVLDSYMTHIAVTAKEIMRSQRELQLHTNCKDMTRRRGWDQVPFMHPATFDTLALDPEIKCQIIADLDNFAASESFYHRVGRAWKRGYLLYGPPGTGKSSMIAAIANKMRYDVYDLELTEVQSNAELRKLLLNTSNRSIIVIEDIDCSLDLSGQRKNNANLKEDSTVLPSVSLRSNPEANQVTLSGLLNFTDGLWSCCGTERIFIFTTNSVEKLDPALLRAGRMDMHIHMGYCTFLAFKTLAKNYLQISDHSLFVEVETVMKNSASMTPADVSEVLIKYKDDPETALKALLETLRALKAPPEANAADEHEKFYTTRLDVPTTEKFEPLKPCCLKSEPCKTLFL